MNNKQKENLRGRNKDLFLGTVLAYTCEGLMKTKFGTFKL
jgi:hypothetical protein